MNNSIQIVLAAVDQLSGPLDRASRKLDIFSAKAQSIGQSLERAGIRAGAMGTAVQAGLNQAGLDIGTLVTAAVDTERALYGIANTAGLAGAQATSAVGEWTIAVNQIAQATNQSQALVVQAFNDLIAKGIDPAAAVQMLKPIGQAATAAGANIGDMAAAAQAAFSKLKIPAGQVTQSLDIMAQAGKAGAFELRDMAGFFDKLSASAANLGMSGTSSLAGLAAAAQIARRGTGDAAQAATNLDNFLGKLNAQVTYAAFKKMGVDLGKLKEEAKASGDYIGHMATAIQNITGGDTAKVAALFSDIQAGAFIQGMLRDLDDYKQIRAEALAANGVSAQDFATAMQSAGAQIDAFKISAAATADSGGAIRDIVAALKSLSDWANEHPDLTKWIILGSAGAIAAGAVVAGIGATITAVGSLTAALSGVAAFLVANPVVAAIIGVAAAGVFVYTHWDEIVAAAKKALASIKATLGEWKKIGVDIIDGLWQGIQATIRKPIDAIGDLAKKLPQWAKDLLGIKSPSRVFAEIGQDIGRGLVAGIEDSEGAVKNAVDNLGDAAIVSAKPIAVTLADDKRYRRPDGQFGSSATGEMVQDIQKNHGAFAAAAYEYRATVGDIADSMRSAFGRAFKGMEDALVNFAMTGKLNFKSLSNSIIADLVRIQIQQSITRPLAQAMGFMDFGGMFKFAQGGAPGGVSAWRNQVVDKPTLFAFANGGIMGEAGPEAIMPLRRDSQGRLGVSAEGRTAPVVNVTQHITIDSRSDKASIVAAMIAAKEQAKVEIMDSMRRGGAFARA
jgi:TP901 family phage tail tape measure protein